MFLARKVTKSVYWCDVCRKRMVHILILKCTNDLNETRQLKLKKIVALVTGKLRPNIKILLYAQLHFTQRFCGNQELSYPSTS